VRGTVLVFSLSILSAVAAYLLRIFVARELGPYDYGVFYSVLAVMSFIGLFNNLGFNDAITKFVSEFKVKKEYEKIKSIIIYSLGIKFTIFSLIMILVFHFSNYIAISIIHEPSAGLIVKILTFTILLTAISPIFHSVLRGLGKIKYFSIAAYSSIVFVFIFSVILLPYSSNKLITYSICFLLSGLIVDGLGVFFFIKSFPLFSRVRTIFSKELLTKFLKFSIPTFAYSIAFTIISYTDTIMLSIIKGPELVGNYQIAVPSAKIVLFFAMALNAVLLPLFSEMWTKGEKKEISSMVSKIVKLSFVITLPISMIFIAFPKIIITLLFGNNYILAAEPLRILAIGYLFYTAASIHFSVMNGIGKPKLTAKVIYSAAVLNFFLNLVLIPSYGLIGAAIASMTSFILSLLISFALLKKEFSYHNIKIKSPLGELTKTLIFGGLTVLLITLLKNVIVLNPWIELILIGSVALVFYFLLVLRFGVVTIDDLKLIKELNLPIPNVLIRILKLLVSE